MIVKVMPNNDPESVRYFDTMDYDVQIIGCGAELELTEVDEKSIEIWDRNPNRLWARTTSENTLILMVGES